MKRPIVNQHLLVKNLYFLRWEEAMVDFEAALGLDSHIPAAHVNLGLIQMTRMSNPTM